MRGWLEPPEKHEAAGKQREETEATKGNTRPQETYKNQRASHDAFKSPQDTNLMVSWEPEWDQVDTNIAFGSELILK